MRPGNGNGRPGAPHQDRKAFALRQLEAPETRVEFVKIEAEAAETTPNRDGTRCYRKTGRKVMTVIYRGGGS